MDEETFKAILHKIWLTILNFDQISVIFYSTATTSSARNVGAYSRGQHVDKPNEQNEEEHRHAQPSKSKFI